MRWKSRRQGNRWIFSRNSGWFFVARDSTRGRESFGICGLCFLEGELQSSVIRKAGGGGVFMPSDRLLGGARYANLYFCAVMCAERCCVRGFQGFRSSFSGVVGRWKSSRNRLLGLAYLS